MQDTTKRPARLRMSGKIKFPDAERLAAQLDQLLNVRPVEIDALQLEETDAAILQVIASARVQANRLGQNLALILPETGTVADLVSCLGLAALLAAEGKASSNLLEIAN